jgi:hypothetical protein
MSGMASNSRAAFVLHPGLSAAVKIFRFRQDSGRKVCPSDAQSYP